MSEVINAASSSTETLASHYALHVALQTMKERCQSLQQRLTKVEEENLSLRMKFGMDKPQLDTEQYEKTDADILREKVGELTRQKFQLTEHIAMVATENRQLWSRLSKLTKDNQTLGDSLNKMKDSLHISTHQNLIRSKTFTQNSPNPILRQKMNANMDRSPENLSLEEISLKVLNEFLEGKAEVEKKCTEIMSGTQNNSLGFGYLNEESSDVDLQNDTKKCTTGMVDIKKELLRQQSDLKVALSSLRQRKVLEICVSCKNKSRKPITADKNLETDDILTTRYEHKFSSAKFHDGYTTSKIETTNIDFLEQKRLADGLDKMCPMCGQKYLSGTTFDEFQEHVESHFIDESELDMSIDKNFELISHTVGNF